MAASLASKVCEQSVRAHLNEPTESLLDAIVSDVYKFGDSTVLTDDACLVAAELYEAKCIQKPKLGERPGATLLPLIL